MLRRLLPGLLLIALATSCTGTGSKTRTKIGQIAPNFAATTLGGETFELEDLRGCVVWINFFAAWCGPCMTELPRLQREVWDRLESNQDFMLLAIGREHNLADLSGFRAQHKYSLPLVADPERTIYSRYASGTIPRNFIVDTEGRIVHQSIGHSPDDFRHMVTLVDQLLRAVSATAAR